MAWPPDVDEQLGLLHQLAGVAHQRLQQGELLAGEGDLLALQGHLVAAAVQGQATVGEVSTLAAGGTDSLAQQHPDTGHHLPDAERLAHVVVGPRIQQPHLLLLGVPRREHQHGIGVVLADGVQDLHAIAIRQAQIQDHQVGVEVAILRHPLGDADRLAHLMSFGDQADPQKTADGRLIVDDQYVSHSASRLLIEKGGDHQAAGALRASGREMRMQVPLPLGPANAQMRPPWTSIIAREMARPSPVPRLPQSPTGWV